MVWGRVSELGAGPSPNTYSSFWLSAELGESLAGAQRHGVAAAPSDLWASPDLV